MRKNLELTRHEHSHTVGMLSCESVGKRLGSDEGEDELGLRIGNRVPGAG